jgi:hypothetical protein
VRDLLERLVSAPLARIGIFLPSIVEGLALDVLGMAWESALHAVRQLSIAAIGHDPLLRFRNETLIGADRFQRERCHLNTAAGARL